MGKRKYDSEESTKTKKSKNDQELESNDEGNDSFKEQPQNEPSSEKTNTTTSKPHIFDIKHFRKELSERQGQTMVLTQFLQACLNPDCEVDYMLEYLKIGGNSHEILRQISQDNKKNLTLATPTFHLFHLIILKVQSSLPHMITITEEACRYFLNMFIPTLEIMISENSGPRHRKIILKLLTSIVTLNPDLGIEVLNHAPLTPKNLQYILEKANYKEKDNVRTSFVHFITSFLIDGHLPLIKALLEKQGLLPLVIPGLIQDEPDAVLMFLNILKNNVINNTLISKTLKLKTFSHQILHNLFKIFLWRGPPEMSSELKKESHEEIMSLLSDIILTLYTSHKYGLYFVDNTLGTSDANKNQNLYKSLLTLKRPWENNDQCETILEIIYKCPDLHRAVINIIEQSFQPQHSPAWEKTVSFIIRLLDKLKPEEIIPKLSKLNAAQTANFIRFVALPVPILKVIQTNIGTDHTISLYCVRVLVKMLQTLKRFMQILEFEDENGRSIELKNKLEHFLPKHIPPPISIVSLINDVINGVYDKGESQDYRLTKLCNTDALLLLVDLLILINNVQPSLFESLDGSIKMKSILQYSLTLSGGQISLLKFKIVSLWLMLDSSALTLHNPIFKDLFLIMLEVYTSDEDDTWIEAKETLYIFFKNTDIFEADDDEIHLILYTLRNSKVQPISLIADIVEYVLSNSTELSEYIRSQVVNFEISDENTKSDLDQLFNDLMNNKNGENCLFIENKIPSPFIVGSIQFIQNNRDAKKNLKQFLCIYVTNLLHWNYSPELTEVLIGDSKLDVRSYVADWMVKSIPLSETTCNDNTLLNLSKSIISSEDITLTDIFPVIESPESIEFKIMDVAFRIDVSKPISSSNLFVWARYLMFCVVRLTNMEKFEKKQQQKIINYFEVIMVLGKTHHMVDVCRNITSSLLKNAHFLKVYKPLDVNKYNSSIIATELILDIIKRNHDIVNYLNKKYFILKSYQEKNYNEILKAFIKINKKKNVNSEHTLKVMELIGLSKEGDEQVFKHIFTAAIDASVKVDKEPSLVQDLLCILIDKYSKLNSLDLSQDIIQNAMSLYSNLLTNHELMPNLSKLEQSLSNYFENKPHQIALISEEDFKKFFNVNTTRKTMSHLASVLLKHNKKFCIVFKEEINRPDILSLRELTLPLGNAMLNHIEFIFENKDILDKIYEEYKSNINKFLEKPHKVGQVYLSSWQLIRKLVIECMSIQDCQKLFNKSYKFETIELSHLHLIQVAFLKLCLSNTGCTKDHLTNYFMTMLHLISNALKENKDDGIVSLIVSNIDCVIQFYKSGDFKIDQTKDFNKITESGIWHGFCKLVLKEALKVRTADQANITGPHKMSLLTSFVKLFYSNDHEDIVTLFDMVTSHSEFLNVMLSYHSPDIKLKLLEFLYVLISTNKSVMKAQQIPVFLSAYRATRSASDRTILTILQFYESNDLPVNEFKPYVFGDTAANFYSVRKNRMSSLWSHPSPNQVLNLFDRETIDRTVKHFPVNQKLDYSNETLCQRSLVKTYLNKPNNKNKIRDNETSINNFLVREGHKNILVEIKEDIQMITHTEEDDGIYDPAFLYPLLSHLLAPGSVASCFKLLRSGLLSLAVMGLSSHCHMMRAAAYHVLHRFCLLLETETRHKNDKLLLTDFVNTLRQSLTTAINTPCNGALDVKNPRLPAIGALYLARALMVSTSPSEPLYKPVNNFLIAKQFVDLTVVPDFLSLFHDNDLEAIDRRLWILDIIKDGTKTMTDVNVVFKTMCLKMIMDFYSTVLSDKKTKVNILNALNSIISIPRAFEILVEGYGFISWLHFIVRQMDKDRPVVKKIIVLMRNMICSLNINVFVKHCSKININNDKVDVLTEFTVKSDIEYEILGIAADLLPNVDCLDAEDLVEYVKMLNLITKRSIKFLTKKQILNVVEKCSVSLKGTDNWRSLNRAVVLNNPLMLCSKDITGNELAHELNNLVHTYVA